VLTRLVKSHEAPWVEGLRVRLHYNGDKGGGREGGREGGRDQWLCVCSGGGGAFA